MLNPALVKLEIRIKKNWTNFGQDINFVLTSISKKCLNSIRRQNQLDE